MEGNELNVFSQTHPDDSEKDDSLTSENIARYNKGGFRNFVEESTLRNISLDELEELSDTGCVSSDGNIRRTPSSVSSEQAVRIAFVLEWNSSYFSYPEGMLRLALLMCSTISLGCVSSAGESEEDILDMPISSSIRAHLFVTVFSFLVAGAFFILGVTTLVESFPLYWNFVDAFLHGSICVLFLFSSTTLLNAEHPFHHDLQPSDWTKVQISLSAVFGFLCSLACIFIAIIRSCAIRTPAVPEDIVLTSLRSS